VFTLIVRFDLPDDAAVAQFDALTSAALPLIRSNREPGTLVYQPYTVEGEPLARIFYEVYRDQAAHADHERQPHTEEFLAAVRAIVTTIRVETLTESPSA
jgi:quinol monooxygenase YgiN